MNEHRNQRLDDAERRDRLRLIRSENVGPITFRRLLDRYGTAETALRELPGLARRGGRRSTVRICSVGEADSEIAAFAALGARLVVLGEPEYPPQLAAIEDAPATLGVIGDVALLRQAAIAVVGSRNASLNGRTMAGNLARDLGTSGFVIISGLARGIDAEAHRGGLATGTVGVLAGGVDVCYPRENAELYAQIAQHGALVSEARLGWRRRRVTFPGENRVISGLSRGVLVVEANLRSGSLITARTALEQGRDVFAVPGSPLDPRARGCNDLIRQGATLAESATDVLPVLGSRLAPQPLLTRTTACEPPPTNGEDGRETNDARRGIAERLSPAPVAVDEIIRTCQLSPALVSTILLEWELAGRVERHPGNRVSLTT